MLQRVWDVDALKCEGCGGRMRFIAVIQDRAVIEGILRHLGEEAEEPMVREGARPVRSVGVTANRARGERGAQEGDVCPQRVDGEGIGHRGSGRVAE